MHTLRTRLTLAATLTALITVAIVAVISVTLIRRGFDRLAVEQRRDQAAQVAERLGRFYAERGSLPDSPLERRVFSDQNADILPRRMVLTDANWRVRFDNRGGAISLRGLPLPLRLRNQAVAATNADQVVGYVLVPFSGDTSELGTYERDFLARIYLSVLVGSVLACLAAAGIAALAARQLTAPLAQLRDAAARLASGARHEPIAPPPDAELAELANSFNQMAAQLEQQQQLRRHQLADIAHELRTPLSVLQLQIESVHDGIAAPTPELIDSLGEEVTLLTRLVDDLRLLSLVDAGQLSLTLEAVDATAAISRALQAAAPRARQQQITISSTPAGVPLLVRADPQRLAQILGNLIENALRYTQPGGQVVVAAQRGGGGVQITVRDTGVGIAPADLARIFETFYRADQARTRETGGSGLGLAIVQRLVTIHGGRVWAESTMGIGTTIVVELPGASTNP